MLKITSAIVSVVYITSKNVQLPFGNISDCFQMEETLLLLETRENQKSKVCVALEDLKDRFVSKFDLLKGHWQVPLTPRALEIGD